MKRIYQRSLHLSWSLFDRFASHDVIDFGKFRLHIDPRDYGGRMYRDPHVHDDLRCPLQRELIESLRPETFIDIGANYGFTSVVHRLHNPSARIVAVEPSAMLQPFLERNLRENIGDNYSIVDAVCGDVTSAAVSFATNPGCSQDNRVVGEAGWVTTRVPSITVTDLIQRDGLRGPFFIKLDVQGFEEKVFAGAWSILTSQTDWIVKSEFAPFLLRKQGTDPVEFLRRLVRSFSVLELPKRVRFRGDDLRSLALTELHESDCERFLGYIESLSRGLGWCDLLIRPKGHGTPS